MTQKPYARETVCRYEGAEGEHSATRSRLDPVVHEKAWADGVASRRHGGFRRFESPHGSAVGDGHVP